MDKKRKITELVLVAILSVIFCTILGIILSRGILKPVSDDVVDNTSTSKETTPTPTSSSILYGDIPYEEYISNLERDIKEYEDILDDANKRWSKLDEQYKSLSDQYEKLQEKLHIYESNVEKLYNNRYSYAIKGDIDYALIIYVENLVEYKALNDIDLYLALLLADFPDGVIVDDNNDSYRYVEYMVDMLDQFIVNHNGDIEAAIVDWNDTDGYTMFVENMYYIYSGNTKTIYDLMEIVYSRLNSLRKAGKY